ncbi:MAG: CDP-diacylglycerol--serine O-phosphatidyltransferase [Bacteroidia bacterium]|nr:CDP-diacylglycerol--serine O-phosphatidyltransferase [Bacteroidia bacterium]
MIRKHIPNFITCLNVVSGSIAVLFAIKGELTISVILIIAAAIFDFFDGMAARLLKSYSPMGKELDSLADMISFGLAPGALMMVMMEYALFGVNVRAENFSDLSIWEITCISTSLLIPVFSALRLAKFNIDTRQTESFIGLPTPANALLIAALALITEHGRYEVLDAFILQPVVLLLITIIMSLLLVSELPMFSLKLKNLSWIDNKVRFAFLTISAVLILAFNIYGIAAAIISFILISVFLRFKGNPQG